MLRIIQSIIGIIIALLLILPYFGLSFDSKKSAHDKLGVDKLLVTHDASEERLIVKKEERKIKTPNSDESVNDKSKLSDIEELLHK